MNIGQASIQTELPVKTIRYYEDIDLVSPDRLANGYRDYSSEDVHRLRFLQRARGLGFSIEECRLLLSLYKDKNRASADVKEIALQKVSQIDQKIAELKTLRETLSSLAGNCQGDGRPQCPIIEDLAGGIQA